MLNKRISSYLLLISLALLLLGCSRSQLTEAKLPTVTINNHTWQVELADTPEKQYLGLSNRADLCDNCGMLFDFNPPIQPSFVMRQMNFPLDIVWIAENRVVAIDENLQPQSLDQLTRYTPPVAVDYVLELNAGEVKRVGVKEGDEVTLISNY